jgi:MoaA/NifB/PqqE/SkfB family radical SAM enzyme
MIKLISKIPAYKLFRRFGFPKLYPLNLTISLTYRCNSRCRTCNIFERKVREFTTEEFDKTFESIGPAPYWVTMSGGEPFLRKDITEICKSAYRHFKPGILNIPTNGILSGVIPGKVEEIVQNSPGAQVIVNLSLDGIREKHDEIRNVKNNFSKSMETYEKLTQLNYPNLSIGIHTVISKFNARNIPEIYEEIMRLAPDSYITEIAEERRELGTVGQEITPTAEAYASAVDFLSRRIREQEFKGISRITQAFRLQYYEQVKTMLKENREIIPCYAGILSAQIAPDGEVWACCVKTDCLGQLREVNYDFGKIWFSERARKVRKSIRQERCFCPLANAGYTNMLASSRVMSSIATGIAMKSLKRNFGRK